jgi:hypothetical protein
MNQPSQAAIDAVKDYLSKIGGYNANDIGSVGVNPQLLGLVATIERDALEQAAKLVERAHKSIGTDIRDYQDGMVHVCTEAAAAIRAMKP